MFGKIELENFTGLTSMPQRAATAWGAVENLIGVKYKPLLYCGKQIVKGTNHFFIVEMTTADKFASRHIAILAINEFEGKYELVEESLEKIL